MKHLNSETLKNITDTMPRERNLKVGERHPNTGMPVTGSKKSKEGRFKAFLVRMAAKRMNKGKLEQHVLGRFHGPKR